MQAFDLLLFSIYRIFLLMIITKALWKSTVELEKEPSSRLDFLLRKNNQGRDSAGEETLPRLRELEHPVIVPRYLGVGVVVGVFLFIFLFL